ncbi:MAG: hypothetical protein ACXABY_04630 [Candidatus Thorarchaeota archaeon]|jgi:hypothetical protein
MQPCPEDARKFNTTGKYFGGFNNAELPVKPGVIVTDILIRGGGGTITFSDGVTVEYVFGFRPDEGIPSGGMFDVTLCGPRADLVYQNVVSQCVCDMVDWLLQCSDLNRRVSILELQLGLAKQFRFTIPDWAAVTRNTIEIPNLGPIITPGQIGPHELGTNRIYHITVWREDGTPVRVGVDTEVEVNFNTGLVRLKKPSLAPPFDGRVIIS